MVDQGVGIFRKGGNRSLRVGDLGVAWLQLFEYKKGDFAYTVWGRGNMRGNLCAFYLTNESNNPAGQVWCLVANL